jgi:hypothetical protein
VEEGTVKIVGCEVCTQESSCSRSCPRFRSRLSIRFHYCYSLHHLHRRPSCTRWYTRCKIGVMNLPII